MPALKMKCKTSTGHLREGSNLHVHRSSTMISKGQHAAVRTVQHAKVHESVQISLKVSSNATYDEHGRHTEAVDFRDSCSEACDQTSGSPISSSDTSSIEKVDYEKACPQIVETIFSPILEQNEAEDKSTIDSDEVTDDENTKLPHLVADDSDDSSCSPSDQSCSVTDFNISDLIVPAITFDGSTGFADLITSASPDYDHINFDLLYDMEERCMLFPFDERSLATNSTLDVYNEECVMNTDDSLLYLAIHQLKKSDQEAELNCQNGDMEEGELFDPHFFIKIPEISDMVSSIFPLPLQMEIEKKTVTLVLDLDETLVHSTLDCCNVADFSFPVFFNMKENIVYVRQRPYLHLFLERVSQMFEVVIFTASQSIYAEKLLDTLDPSKKLISHRFYRESCVFSEGSYAKDLTILGVDLAKVAIIDNSPQVFRLQVNNGIPIKSWFDDPSDNALITLLPFLETLALAEDVRPIIAKRFNNKEE